MVLRTVLIALLLAGGLATAPATRAEPAAGTVWTEPATGIAFVWVPGGGFEMGCRGDSCPDSEKPAHPRRVGGFWMSRTEITQGQWLRLMETNPSKYQKGDSYPVDQVTWEDAHALIGKLNKGGSGTFRLPSEAEWEYACRAGVPDDPYCGGTKPETVAAFIANSKMAPMAVGQKSPNRFGLFDMSGNLNEWVEDCWTESHAGAPADGRARTDGACLSRVLRGGSWGNYPPQVRVTSRRSDTDVKCPFIGLRLVRER
jgi:formylglycine-generating enzyme required for sulfatase activity